MMKPDWTYWNSRSSKGFCMSFLVFVDDWFLHKLIVVAIFMNAEDLILIV